jgi:hypothetical protein
LCFGGRTELGQVGQHILLHLAEMGDDLLEILILFQEILDQVTDGEKGDLLIQLGQSLLNAALDTLGLAHRCSHFSL